MKRHVVKHAILVGALAAGFGCGDNGQTGMLNQASNQEMAGSGSQPSNTKDAENGITLPKQLVPELKMLDLPAGGRAMFTDAVKVKPGEDITLCTYVEGTTDGVSYIHDSYSTQSKYGHHVVLYYAPKPEEPGTRECGDMEKYRMILGGSGGETATMSKLPGNVVSEIPAGVQFVMNHHWINYGEEAMDVQAMLVTVPPDTDKVEDLVIARPMAVVSSNWELPPGQQSTETIECTFEEDVPTLSILGHEHEWGTWVKAEKISAEGDSEMLFDHAFMPEMANNATVFYYPLEDPLMFHAGDTLRFTCEWMNDTAAPLTFPREMCVFFANTLSDKELTCANGNWVGL